MLSARDELRRLAAEGNLSSESVVATAANPSNVLYTHFEWDDTAAGHKYRLVQAAELIRSYRVEYRETAGGPRTVREFTSAKEAGYVAPPGKYLPTEEVLRDEQATGYLLQSLKRELAELRRRYGHLKEFAEMLRDAAA